MNNMNKSNRPGKDRRFTVGFSIAGSLLFVLLFVFINYTTSPGFPWFIFPSYAILWWPIGVILHDKQSAKMLSLVGSFITIALLFVTNYLTSWGYPWFLFPSFAILWWPLGVFFGSKNHKIFSLISSFVLIVFFVMTNLITTPSIIWFHYPVLAVIWWPVSVFFANNKWKKIYSILGSLLLISFLGIDNMLKTPDCPWVLFTLFPILMWPIATFMGKHLGKVGVSIFLSLTGIAYYVTLNFTLFQGFPWAMYPAYALLWWPMAVVFARSKNPLGFSIAGSLLTAAMFIATNWITTPNQIWAVYPIFAIAWWPLAVYFFHYRQRMI